MPYVIKVCIVRIQGYDASNMKVFGSFRLLKVRYVVLGVLLRVLLKFSSTRYVEVSYVFTPSSQNIVIVEDDGCVHVGRHKLQ